MVQGIFMTDDDVRACGGAHLGGAFLGPVRHSIIKDVRFGNFGKAATSEISVNVALGKTMLTAAQSEACIGHVLDDNFRGAPVAVPTKDYHLQFLFDGKWFRVTPGSRYTLKLFPKPVYPLGITF